MSSAKLIIGDVFDVLASLPDQSVQSVITSPPYWRKRAYLPADHPDKSKEIGQENSPGEFLATMLRITDALWRVVRDDGTIWFNLGDSAAQSGGAGGDYNNGGWRDGQQRYRRPHSNEVSRWTNTGAAWLAGVIDSDGSISTHINHRGDKTPTFVPWVRLGQMRPEGVRRAQEITGVGRVTQDKRGVWLWVASAQQCRYVLEHVWPYLVIKQKQALAAIELSERIEEGNRSIPSAEELAIRHKIRDSIQAWNHGDGIGAGDEWKPRNRCPIHLPEWSAGTPRAKSVCWIPELFGASLAYGRNLLTGEPCQQWITRPQVTWCKPAPTPGEIIDKFREGTELIVWASKNPRYYFDLDAVREKNHPERMHEGMSPVPSRVGGMTGIKSAGTDADSNSRPNRIDRPWNPKGVPPLNYWVINTSGYEGAHFATFPPELIVRPVITSCPPGGVILDPFGGSGTTASVATGHGRECWMIDLDARNADLCRERVGMWLTVEHFASEVPA